MAVYGLRVEPHPNFIADGVVSHNCDAFRYGIVNVFDDTGATTLSTGTELNPTLRRTPNSNNVPDSVEYDPAHDVYDYVPELLEN